MIRNTIGYISYILQLKLVSKSSILIHTWMTSVLVCLVLIWGLRAEDVFPATSHPFIRAVVALSTVVVMVGGMWWSAILLCKTATGGYAVYNFINITRCAMWGMDDTTRAKMIMWSGMYCSGDWFQRIAKNERIRIQSFTPVQWIRWAIVPFPYKERMLDLLSWDKWCGVPGYRELMVVIFEELPVSDQTKIGPLLTKDDWDWCPKIVVINRDV